MTEYKQKSTNNLYSSVMDIIVKANKQRFMEESYMCEALREIANEINKEAYEKEKQEAINAAIAEKNAALAEKDARIAELEAQLAKISS